MTQTLEVVMILMIIIMKRGGGTRPNRGRGKRRKLARPFMGHRAHARFSASFQHRDVHPGIFVGGLHPPNDRPPPH